MATLQVRNKSYRVLFCHRGRRHTFTVGKVSKREAELLAANVDRILLRVEQGLLTVPAGTDIVEFVKGDGKPREAPPAPTVTFGGLAGKYLAAHGNGAVEDSSLATIRIHLNHLTATLGERFPVRDLTLSYVQRHTDRRRSMSYR